SSSSFSPSIKTNFNNISDKNTKVEVTVTVDGKQFKESIPIAIGQRGADGAKGEKGDKGDKGDKGEKGDKGDDGYSVLMTEAFIVETTTLGSAKSGEIGSSGKARTVVDVYKGTTRLTYTSGTPTTGQFSISIGSKTSGYNAGITTSS